MASRPKVTRMIGNVAAWAASETPRLSASQPGTRPRPSDPIQAVNGVAHAINPAVASDDSWNPASPMSAGSDSSRSMAAQPRAAAARPARPLSRASSTDAGHQGGTDHRWRPARERHVGDDRHDRHDRSPPSPEPTGQGRHRGRHDRDVPAGDRDDVAHPGRREGRREIPVDEVAQADEDARRETGFRFREDARQGLGGAPPDVLEATTRVVRRRADLERPGCQRPDRPDPLEVHPVRRVRAGTDLPVDDDPVARGHERVAGKGRGHAERARHTGRRDDRRGLVPVPWRARRRHDEGPRSRAVGRLLEERGRRRHQRQSDGDQAGTDDHRDERRRSKTRPRLGDEQDGGERQGDRRAEMARGDASRRGRRDDRADGESTAATHVSGPTRGP